MDNDHILTTNSQQRDPGSVSNNLEQITAMLEIIFENSIDMISAYDKDLKLIAWSRKCEEKTGKSKSTVLGKHLSEIIDNDKNVDGIIEMYNKALNGEEVVCESGHHPFPEFSKCFITPLQFRDTPVLGVINLSHDLTSIKDVTDKLVSLNQALSIKNEELELTNSEMASFSYVASHDLQEPLRKIQTFGNRIREKEFDNLSPQGMEYFRRMESAALRMQTLIDDLLTFSRTNTLPRNFKLVDLNELLNEVKYELKETITENHAVIDSGNLPHVNVIAFQFKQLLTNILLNAIKYHRVGIAPTIKITCNLIKKENLDASLNLAPKDYYQLSFIDNGIGFEMQYSSKIFELFQRLHGKSEYPGTGLGLAICKKVILNHGGQITASAQVNEGATFNIYLPV